MVRRSKMWGRTGSGGASRCPPDEDASSAPARRTAKARRGQRPSCASMMSDTPRSKPTRVERSDVKPAIARRPGARSCRSSTRRRPGRNTVAATRSRSPKKRPLRRRIRVRAVSRTGAARDGNATRPGLAVSVSESCATTVPCDDRRVRVHQSFARTAGTHAVMVDRDADVDDRRQDRFHRRGRVGLQTPARRTLSVRGRGLEDFGDAVDEPPQRRADQRWPRRTHAECLEDGHGVTRDFDSPI